MNLQKAIESYQMPDEALELIHRHKPLGLAGPTGAGKGTMTQYLTQTGKYAPVVSDTTRLPRPTGNGYEVSGVQYWFINDDVALQKLVDKKYIEAKLVHGDTLYGTSIEAYRQVAVSGRTAILEIDVQGMGEFMRIDENFEAIFLLPPNFESWSRRIDGRGDMTLENKVRRFKTAIVEYSILFENERFYPVVNTEVVEAAEIIRSEAYRQPEYRQRALDVALKLRDATQAFLDDSATY